VSMPCRELPLLKLKCCSPGEWVTSKGPVEQKLAGVRLLFYKYGLAAPVDPLVYQSYHLNPVAHAHALEAALPLGTTPVLDEVGEGLVGLWARPCMITGLADSRGHAPARSNWTSSTWSGCSTPRSLARNPRRSSPTRTAPPAVPSPSPAATRTPRGAPPSSPGPGTRAALACSSDLACSGLPARLRLGPRSARPLPPPGARPLPPSGARPLPSRPSRPSSSSRRRPCSAWRRAVAWCLQLERRDCASWRPCQPVWAGMYRPTSRQTLNQVGHCCCGVRGDQSIGACQLMKTCTCRH